MPRVAGMRIRAALPLLAVLVAVLAALAPHPAVAAAPAAGEFLRLLRKTQEPSM